MKLVFLSGPYRDERGPYFIRQNIRRAEEVAVELWQMGYAVLCPHKNSEMLDGACPDEVWLAGALEMMRRCDLVIMLPGWRESEGARAECSRALGIPMLVKEWKDTKEARDDLLFYHPPA